MTTRTVVGITLAVIVAIGALVYVDRTVAQPVAQMPMAPRGQMMGQMQQHMSQMTANLRAMRVQLDKIKPDLLTPQERPLYEYLKLLQAQMEAMHAWMGTAQGAMRQMPGMGR